MQNEEATTQSQDPLKKLYRASLIRWIIRWVIGFTLIAFATYHRPDLSWLWIAGICFASFSFFTMRLMMKSMARKIEQMEENVGV